MMLKNLEIRLQRRVCFFSGRVRLPTDKENEADSAERVVGKDADDDAQQADTDASHSGSGVQEAEKEK